MQRRLVDHVGMLERQQVHIGKLMRSMNPRDIEPALVRHTELIRPELVNRVGRGLPQSLDDLLQWLRIRIAWMRYDANAAILSNGR